MADQILAHGTRPDGQVSVEVSGSDGLFRYHVFAWVLSGPDYPYEPQPGYWSPRHVSGFYDNLKAAMRDASAEHGVTFEGMT